MLQRDFYCEKIKYAHTLYFYNLSFTRNSVRNYNASMNLRF